MDMSALIKLIDRRITFYQAIMDKECEYVNGKPSYINFHVWYAADAARIAVQELRTELLTLESQLTKLA